VTNEYQAQLTAAELHERLTEAEAILDRIASSPISQIEGGHALALSRMAQGYSAFSSKRIACDVSPDAREQQQ